MQINEKILKQVEYESTCRKKQKHVREKTRKREEQISTLPPFTSISLSEGRQNWQGKLKELKSIPGQA